MWYTTDGIPIVPNPWAVKQNMMLAGVSAKTATALVSLSASNVLAGLMIAAAIRKIWKAWDHGKRCRAFLRTASSAAENNDQLGAIENYKRALELERTPGALIALGQVYSQRMATRPYAYQSFAEAVQLLGIDPSRTVPYYGAQLSLRGIAGLQALATADVIGVRHAEYWQEKVGDLANATIHSFASTAEKLDSRTDRWTANPLVRPPHLSAAINRYLAAHVACQCPVLDDRQQMVTGHITEALAAIGRAAQTDEQSLRQPAEHLRNTWVRTVLPEHEADLLLATA